MKLFQKPSWESILWQTFWQFLPGIFLRLLHGLLKIVYWKLLSISQWVTFFPHYTTSIVAINPKRKIPRKFLAFCQSMFLAHFLSAHYIKARCWCFLKLLCHTMNLLFVRKILLCSETSPWKKKAVWMYKTWTELCPLSFFIDEFYNQKP